MLPQSGTVHIALVPVLLSRFTAIALDYLLSEVEWRFAVNFKQFFVGGRGLSVFSQP
jgi:hypothetical protein